MQNQAVDHSLLDTLLITTSLDSLVKGYLLNCTTEAKSRKTISSYEMVLKNFMWYCKQNNFPQVQHLQFLQLLMTFNKKSEMAKSSGFSRTSTTAGDRIRLGVTR